MWLCVISRFRHEVEQNCALVGNYVASSGNVVEEITQKNAVLRLRSCWKRTVSRIRARLYSLWRCILSPKTMCTETYG